MLSARRRLRQRRRHWLSSRAETPCGRNPDEQFHVADEDPLEGAASPWFSLLRNTLVGDAEVVPGPFRRLDRIVEIRLVLGLLVEQHGGSDVGSLIVSQRELGDPGGLPRSIKGDTVKNLARSSVSVFFCHA